MQEGCIMLFTYYSFFLFCQHEKGLLNFVSKRIIFLKLVYRINNTWYSFKKNKLLFKLVKPHFIGRILSKFGQKCLEIASTLKYAPSNSCITVHNV